VKSPTGDVAERAYRILRSAHLGDGARMLGLNRTSTRFMSGTISISSCMSLALRSDAGDVSARSRQPGA